MRILTMLFAVTGGVVLCAAAAIAGNDRIASGGPATSEVAATSEAVRVMTAQAAPRAPQLRGRSADPGIDVDVELVIAVDVSYSMDPDEQALQREGYITGFNSPEFLSALQQGLNGRVAVTYFEWAGATDQRVVVQWHLLDGPASIKAFTDEIAAAPYRRAYRTSISGALQFSMRLLRDTGYRSLRRVIDVSGDGVNNQGAPVAVVRDEVLERGVTINGLPILLKRPSIATMDIENLDVYYEDCVIGGPGAFVIPIRERDQFREATRTKLVQEIAGLESAVRVIRTADRPRISCTIGERMWQDRWGRMDFR